MLVTLSSIINLPEVERLFPVMILSLTVISPSEIKSSQDLINSLFSLYNPGTLSEKAVLLST